MFTTATFWHEDGCWYVNLQTPSAFSISSNCCQTLWRNRKWCYCLKQIFEMHSILAQAHINALFFDWFAFRVFICNAFEYSHNSAYVQHCSGKKCLDWIEYSSRWWVTGEENTWNLELASAREEWTRMDRSWMGSDRQTDRQTDRQSKNSAVVTGLFCSVASSCGGSARVSLLHICDLHLHLNSFSSFI